MAKSRTTRTEILRQISAARATDARQRKAGQRAVSAYYDRDTGRVMMELTSGFVFGFPAKAVPALARASVEQLAAVELSPGGSGLHWDSIDADLSIPGLLLSSIDRSEKLSELARLAGRSKSRAKAAAARVNGAKGGRPRKATSR